MELPIIILVLSIIFWIPPAFKQFRTPLFAYFLMLAVSDPTLIIFKFLAIIRVYNTQIILTFLTLISVLWFSKKKKITSVVILLSLIFSLLTFYSSAKFSYLIMGFQHTAILFFFSMKAIYFIAENRKVNLFHVLLVFYELTLTLKLFAVVTEADTGVAYFYATSAFQLSLAVFFSVFKEDDERMLLDLNNI